MTAPVAQGFPDWGRQVSEAQFIEIWEPAGNKSAAFAYPLRYVGNARALMVSFTPFTIPLQFEVRFYQDAAGANLIDIYYIDCELSAKALQSVPILGPYCDFRVVPSAGGNYSYVLSVTRIPLAGSYAGSGIEAATMSQHNTPIGGSAGASLLSSIVREGEISWTMSMTGGNWSASMFVRDYLGGKTFIDFMDNTTPTGSRRTLWIPAMTLQVDIGNNNVAAQTYNLAVTRKFNL